MGYYDVGSLAYFISCCRAFPSSLSVSIGGGDKTQVLDAGFMSKLGTTHTHTAVNIQTTLAHHSAECVRTTISRRFKVCNKTFQWRHTHTRRVIQSVKSSEPLPNVPHSVHPDQTNTCLLSLTRKCCFVKHSDASGMITPAIIGNMKYVTMSPALAHTHTHTHKDVMIFMCQSWVFRAVKRGEMMKAGLSSLFFLPISSVMFTRGSFDRCRLTHTHAHTLALRHKCRHTHTQRSRRSAAVIIRFHFKEPHSCFGGRRGRRVIGYSD